MTRLQSCAHHLNLSIALFVPHVMKDTAQSPSKLSPAKLRGKAKRKKLKKKQLVRANSRRLELKPSVDSRDLLDDASEKAQAPKAKPAKEHVEAKIKITQSVRSST